MDRPKIVLGLGNPGEVYRGTRHNLGFRVVERLADSWGVSFETADPPWGTAWSAEVGLACGMIVLAKPRTYMNRSGRAAASLCAAHGAEPSRLLVAYDDADLELGRLRLRPGGGAGGHNGVRAIIDALGTDRFPRLRLGVSGRGRDDDALADYVLAGFEPDEEPVAEELVALGAEAVREVLVSGLSTAMNRYNSRFVTNGDPSDRSEEEG